MPKFAKKLPIPTYHPLPTGVRNPHRLRPLDEPLGEVYVGFHELETLLAPPAPLAPACANEDEDGTDETPEPKRQRLEDFRDTLRAEGLKFPFLLYEEYREKQSGAIPPDLGKVLGPDATQALWGALGDSMRLEGEGWWSVGLPLFTRRLLQDKVRDEGYHEEDMEQARADVKEAQEDARRQRAEDFATINAQEEEIEELRGQLREAKGREDALHAVIHRCRWG